MSEQSEHNHEQCQCGRCIRRKVWDVAGHSRDVIVGA